MDEAEPWLVFVVVALFFRSIWNGSTGLSLAAKLVKRQA